MMNEPSILLFWNPLGTQTGVASAEDRALRGTQPERRLKFWQRQAGPLHGGPADPAGASFKAKNPSRLRHPRADEKSQPIKRLPAPISSLLLKTTQHEGLSRLPLTNPRSTT
jgi:hypothetical protein